MKNWIKSFLFGIGIGTLIEALIFLSPIYDTTLWETRSNLVKLIPVVALNIALTIGILFVGIAVLFLRRVEKK